MFKISKLTDCLPRRFLCRILWLLTLLPIPAAAATDMDALRHLASSGVNVSAMAVDLPTGNVIAQLNPDTRLRPASLTKLFTAAATLKTWGPNKTFDTQILGAKPKQGVVNSDLVFLGGGDPVLNYSGLWQLAAQLSEAGIKQVKGNLVVDQSLFGNIACQTNDRCEAQNNTQFAYDAKLSSAGINYGTWCVAITPADKVGEPAHARLCQLSLPYVKLIGHITTTASNQPNNINVSRTSTADDDQLFLSGSIAANSPVKHIYRSAANTPMQTGQVFREVLKHSGINIAGNIQIKSDENSNKHNLNLLAQVKSIPLNEQLIGMMKYSNDYMADILTLDLLAEQPNINKPLTLQAAGQNLLSINSMPVGDDENAPVIQSGSGLTLENSLSASDMVALLKNMYLRTDLFPSFVGSLTVPKFSPMPIFRGEDPAWLTRIIAKTGSMVDPVTVIGVAGYFRQQNGDWGAFALLINGTKEHPTIPFDQGKQALRETVNRILKRY